MYQRSDEIWLSFTMEDVPLVKFVYLVFTRMLGKSYHGRLRSLLFRLCDVFRAMLDSLVC